MVLHMNWGSSGKPTGAGTCGCLDQGQSLPCSSQHILPAVSGQLLCLSEASSAVHAKSNAALPCPAHTLPGTALLADSTGQNTVVYRDRKGKWPRALVPSCQSEAPGEAFSGVTAVITGLDHCWQYCLKGVCSVGPLYFFGT